MMITRSKAKSISWATLPAEIRLMILEAVAENNHPGWGPLASVCSEWQLCIEKQNFRRLKLQVPCLDDFNTIVGQNERRRRFIRHIWLDIELPKYSCHVCCYAESPSWSDRQGRIVSKGIWKLFRILSTWGSGSEFERREVTLELNAHSPGDWKHWFKNFYFTSHDKDNEKTTHNCSTVDDPEHDWIGGKQIIPPGEYRDNVERLFGSINLRFRKDLPRVNIITSFVVRRQLRRWLKGDSLMLLLNKLSGLNHIIYEPWRQWKHHQRMINDMGTHRYQKLQPHEMLQTQLNSML
jgi:hypothetical protein